MYCSVELAAYQAISAATGLLLAWETWNLDMRKPASCARWAKRGVQCKISMCVSLTAAFMVPRVREMMVDG